MLAASAGVTCVQGREDADSGVMAGHDVTEGNPHLHRRAIGFARDGHQSTHGLDQ